jgi:Tfp pilus assembly protein PilX
LTPRSTRREEGAALLVTMLLMALMGMIGLASLDTVMRDRQMTGFQNQAQSALYAADAGIAEALDIMRTEMIGGALYAGDCISVKVPNTDLGGGLSYVADPDDDEICMLASAEPCAQFDASIEVGQPVFLNTVWNARVEGSAPGGATANVQATVARCHAYAN